MNGKERCEEALKCAGEWLDAGQDRLDRWNHVRERMGAPDLTREEAVKILAFGRPNVVREIKDFLQ